MHTTGEHAAISATRSMPACTHVPVVSLKLSVTRPSNTSPFSGASGSAKRPASPIR